MNIEEKFSVAQQIICDAQNSIPRFSSNFSITPSQFKIISKIINNDTKKTFNSIESWKKIIKMEDPYICCAILNSSTAPETIKEQAIFNIASKHGKSHISSRIIVPFIFASDNKTIQHLTQIVSEVLVAHIRWTDFASQLDKYIANNPNATKLPFANSNVEQFLLKRLVYDGVLKTPTEINSYKSYKLIEYYSDEKSLKEILRDLNSHNEKIITAVMNNKNISPEFRQEALLAGPDISLINFSDNPKEIKMIYESAISGLKEANDNPFSSTTAISLSQSCIANLANYNLLPESCELDLLKRYLSNEIPLSSIVIWELVYNTKHLSVVQEAIKTNNPFMLINATKNSTTPDSMVYEILKKVLSQTNKSANAFTSVNKKIFFTACIKRPLQKEHYNKILTALQNSPTDKKEIAQQMTISPFTPNEILEKISVMYPDYKPLVEFNKKGRDCFDSQNLGRFMDTILTIFQVLHHRIDNNMTVDISDIFFPSCCSPENAVLNNLLTEITNEENDLTYNYAKIYLSTLNRNNNREMATKTIQEFPQNIKKLPLDALKEIKQKIQDDVALAGERKIGIYKDVVHPKNLGFAHKFYDVYLVYAELIKLAPVYKMVNDIIEEKTQELGKKEIDNTLHHANKFSDHLTEI